MNWKKPNLVSMQMLRLIRARVGEALPILIVSAYDWTDIEQETRAMGAKGFSMI